MLAYFHSVKKYKELKDKRLQMRASDIFYFNGILAILKIEPKISRMVLS